MSKQWGDLDKLSKRAGISKALGADGLRYFVKECVAAEAPPQAVSQFFSRIRDRRQRMLAVRTLRHPSFFSFLFIVFGSYLFICLAVVSGLRTHAHVFDVLLLAQQQAQDAFDYELSAAIAMDLGEDNQVNSMLVEAGCLTNYQKQSFIDGAQVCG